MENLSRNKQHFIIMTAIYNELVDFSFGEGKLVRDAAEMIAELCECDKSEIKTAYSKYLKNWKWERLPLLTQSILMMSYTHFYYVDKADKAVVINTAVSLAKEYIDDKQAKFINGILDSGVLA